MLCFVMKLWGTPTLLKPVCVIILITLQRHWNLRWRSSFFPSLILGLSLNRWRPPGVPQRTMTEMFTTWESHYFHEKTKETSWDKPDEYGFNWKTRFFANVSHDGCLWVESVRSVGKFCDSTQTITGVWMNSVSVPKFNAYIELFTTPKW